MKMWQRCIAFFLSVVLLVSLFTMTSFAVGNTGKEHEVILRAANITGEKTEEGFLISCDLLQQTTDQTLDRSIGWIKAGDAKMRLVLLPENAVGTIDWVVVLNNGDKINRVKVTFVVERDILEPINPNIAKFDVNKWCPGSENRASGYESFSFLNPGKDYNINFKWSGFYIYGVRDSYSVTSGHQAGKISDFS